MGVFVKHNKSTQVIPIKRVPCKARYITDVLPTGVWKDQTCFLIGGGPSLINFDFSLIKDFPTIGTNKTFTKYSSTIVYAMDERFYSMVTYAQKAEWKKLHQQWLEYKGIKVFARRSRKFKFDESVYVVNSLSNKTMSFDLKKGIYSGNNSGFGALMLAIGLGTTRIGLLGYDLKVQGKDGGIKTHFHEGYEYQSKSSFQSKLNAFRMCFEEFSSVIAQQGVEVINLNLDSALECFPKEDIKTFLR